MTRLKGTKTAENLLKAFAGESQARNRYTFYAKIAENEGYVQIANIFLETADNERVHGKRFFDFLSDAFHGEEIEIRAGYPVGKGTTEENLAYAAAGEHDEWDHLYPAFADTAEKEGFDDVAQCFRMIAKAEINHEKRFRRLLENLLAKKVFARDAEVAWKCGHCGYIHRGREAPDTCPACLHPQKYFELFCESY